MLEILNKILPNLMANKRYVNFGVSIIQTIQMTVWSGAISFVLGLLFGVTLVVTKKGAILENKVIYQILDKVINFFRSIPFIILLTGVMPLSRLIMGTSIDVRGAIVPLVFGTVPFFSRQIETALSEVDEGLIEAAQSMGLSPWDIIIRVYLRESVGPIVRGTMITIVSLIGLTAMAGAVGAGGLGNFAIQYGHDMNMQDITWLTIILLVIVVNLIQWAGTSFIRRHTH